MSKGTFYFKHDCRARADRKLINLSMSLGMEGIGVYWCIIEMLYDENGYLPLEYERIAFELRTKVDVIKSVINDFDLFRFDAEIDAHQFYSESALNQLNFRKEKSEKTRKSVAKRWEYERNTNADQEKTIRNTNKVKVKVKVKVKYDDDFLCFYSAYPKHIGKEAAWKAWQKRNGDRPDLNTLLKKIESQKNTENWKKENGSFIPHPATWINNARWEDEVESKSQW